MRAAQVPATEKTARLAVLLLGAAAFLLAANATAARAPQDEVPALGPDQHMSMTPMLTGTHGAHPSMTPYMTMTPMMTGTPGPGGDDVTAPQVSLSINNGAATTDNRVVMLHVDASDDADGSGLAWMHVREWGWDHDQGWHAMHHQGHHGGMGRMGSWSEFTSNVEWELSSEPGMKYVTVWVADAAWNISAPAQAMINLVPDNADIGQGETHQYRRNLNVGEELNVEVEPHMGDPDLYVWAPGNAGAPDWWSQHVAATDAVTITAPLDGLYLIEVHGYTGAAYGLHMGMGGSLAATLSGSPSQAKELPAEPLVLTTPEADEAPRAGFRINLPLLTRP